MEELHQMGTILTVLGAVSFLAMLAIARFWFDPRVREGGGRPLLVCPLVIALGVLIASLLQHVMIGVIVGVVIAVLGYLSSFPLLFHYLRMLRRAQNATDAPKAR
jgi:hypothetical protein